jgi:hypothetical protein
MNIERTYTLDELARMKIGGRRYPRKTLYNQMKSNKLRSWILAGKRVTDEAALNDWQHPLRPQPTATPEPETEPATVEPLEPETEPATVEPLTIEEIKPATRDPNKVGRKPKKCPYRNN